MTQLFREKDRNQVKLSCFVPVAGASQWQLLSGSGSVDGKYKPLFFSSGVFMYIGDYLSRRELYSPEKLAFVDAGPEELSYGTEVIGTS